MQETRQQILEILRERGPATVDEIVENLQKLRGAITPVTVRHHLNVLQEQDLITQPVLLHRTTPGRPQHVFTLTDKAKEQFPNNYQQLLGRLLEEMNKKIPHEGINVILEGVAECMASEAHLSHLGEEERLNAAVIYLNQHGYNAYWEQGDEGFVLHTTNCPYHSLADTSLMLCDMDMRFVASLMGVVPRLLGRISGGASSCSYLIPHKSNLR